MDEFESIEDLAKIIKNDFDSDSNKKKITLLYAFNSVGKTRLSTAFSDLTENKVLCYNAFFEDMFSWDNEDYILTLEPNSWIVDLINEQGLENNIIDNFSKIINAKIQPDFNLRQGKVTFKIAKGDDNSQSNIKISKGEESAFIWSIFYTILETVVEALNTEKDGRTTQVFNDYEYVIIDDPVSSIDDTKLISMVIDLIQMIDISQNKNLKFLITTHHALFYNVFFNTFKQKRDYKSKFHVLTKNDTVLKLSEQRSDSPFGYHFVVKNELQKAIETNAIEKYHFNLFRSLLEKTANFLGYNEWYDCILADNKHKFARLINHYSHGKLSELEYKDLSNEDKDLFKEVFNDFIEEFKWKVEKQNANQ